MARNKKLLVVQAAGLGWEFLHGNGLTDIGGTRFQAAESVFPAVTCVVQASLRTGSEPHVHGMPANGFFDRNLHKVMFWEQSARLVRGKRIWEAYRERGKTVAMLFWQQSLGECVDMTLSPAPIHKHHGGMIQACYSKPADLYDRCRESVKREFDLMRYWGPLASGKSSQWIADAAATLLSSERAPHLCFVYLPMLDYDLQRYGPRDKRSLRTLHAFALQLNDLLTAAAENGYDRVVYGDYAIAPCPAGPVYPNRALKNAGLMATRTIRGMTYPDFHSSRAIAVVDHEIAHIYLADSADAPAAVAALSQTPGIESVVGNIHGSDDRAGDLLAVAQEGYWMSYKWWDKVSEAPDYASHVDIHNKPGFDPCELFFGWPPWKVCGNDHRVGGTHGRTGKGREIALASSCPELYADTVIGLSAKIGVWIEQ